MLRRRRAVGEGGQASVELALILPVVVLVLLTVIQVGVVARDRLVVAHAARVAARAVVVDPTHRSAAAALERSGLGRVTVHLSGELRPGGFAVVEARLRLTRIAVVGPAIGDRVLSESVTVLVE